MIAPSYISKAANQPYSNYILLEVLITRYSTLSSALLSDFEIMNAMACYSFYYRVNDTTTHITCFDPTRQFAAANRTMNLEAGFPKVGFELVHIHDKTYLLLGGYSSSSCDQSICPSDQATFIKFDPAIVKPSVWHGTSMPQPRFGHCATRINGTTLMVMGGSHYVGSSLDYHNDHFVTSTLFYSIPDETWSPGPEMNIAKGKYISYGEMVAEAACESSINHPANEPLVLSVAWSKKFSNLSAEIWAPSLNGWSLLPIIRYRPESQSHRLVDVFSFEDATYDFYVLITDGWHGHQIFGLDLPKKQWTFIRAIKPANDPYNENVFGVLPIPSKPTSENVDDLEFHSNTIPYHTKHDNGKTLFCN